MRPAVIVCRSRFVRVLACFFVVAILADLGFDADCDGVPMRTSSDASLAVPDGESPDACANGCVPDCFCCAQAVTHGLPVLPPDGGPVTSASRLGSNAAPAGVHPVPYHPPLRIVSSRRS